MPLQDGLVSFQLPDIAAVDGSERRMTQNEFWQRYEQIGKDCEEPGLPVEEVIERLESLVRDLKQTSIEAES